MELSTLGLLLQAIGAALLAALFLYLSRGDGTRVLEAAGYGWVFLLVALLSLLLLEKREVPFETVPYQYAKTLYIVALGIAALRMDRELPAGKPLALAAVAAVPLSFALDFVGPRPLFDAIHTGLLAIGWGLVALWILRSRTAGLGKQLAGILALATAFVHSTYAILYGLSAPRGRTYPFLAFTGFSDLFFQMLFGIGLIIWAMEETEAHLASTHARAVDDTERSRRRAQIDPLTGTYNRFFLDEIRPLLTAEGARGSIVLIDVDGLKDINDTQGHEEGDKAIWTTASAIKKLVRADDYLIRWGGDEFLVILPGMEEEIARKRFYMLPGKIEEVRWSAAMGKAYKKFLAASVGVTSFSARVPLDRAIERADRLMYERKKAHKALRR